MSKAPRICHGITIDLSLLDHLRFYSRDHRCRVEDYDRLERTLERLAYVDEVCLDHQCWVRAYLRTDRWIVAERRTADLKAKVSKVFARWGGTLKPL